MTPATRLRGDGSTTGSYFKRALWDVDGRTIPWAMQAVNGIRALGMEERLPSLTPLWPYATHLVIAVGYNDLVLTVLGYPTGRSAAQTKASIVALATAAKSFGMTTVFMRVPPFATSGDGHATLEQQVPQPGFEIDGALRDALHASLSAGRDNIDAILNLDGWASDIAPDRWVPGSTDDSTHGTAQAHAAASRELRRYFSGEVRRHAAL